jgi:predicted transcriptional regulator of viral defense system
MLLEIVGREPVFRSSVLLAGEVKPADLGRQLSRWVRSGKLIQLRRGLYALAEPHRKIAPHPFLVANRLKRASYVSLQSALEFHHLIPEYVPTVTSITTGRPETLSNPLGHFVFKHVKKSLFFGFEPADLGDGQVAFVAGPEKALLDLLYLTPRSDDPAYLRELRLQNAENVSLDRLREQARSFESPKLLRAVSKIAALLREPGET